MLFWPPNGLRTLVCPWRPTSVKITRFFRVYFSPSCIRQSEKISLVESSTNSCLLLKSQKLWGSLEMFFDHCRCYFSIYLVWQLKQTKAFEACDFSLFFFTISVLNLVSYLAWLLWHSGLFSCSDAWKLLSVKLMSCSKTSDIFHKKWANYWS